MDVKPKNISEALDQLENFADSASNGLRSRLQSELRDLEEKIEHLKPRLEGLKDEARKAKDKMEVQVKDNPWTSLGIIGILFFVIGFVIGSRRSD